MKSATALTLAIQAKAGREKTLRLLRRAGAAARGSNGELNAVAILDLMLKRLNEGYTADSVARMSNGKLIKLARALVKDGQPEH